MAWPGEGRRGEFIEGLYRAYKGVVQDFVQVHEASVRSPLGLLRGPNMELQGLISDSPA